MVLRTGCQPGRLAQGQGQAGIGEGHGHHRLSLHARRGQVHARPQFTQFGVVFHALAQEATYASILLEKRKSLHLKVAKAIEAGDKAAAKAVFSESTSVVDSIADKKIIHKNKAARHKSRLSAAIKAMA